MSKLCAVRVLVKQRGRRDGGMEGWRDGGMEGWSDGGMAFRDATPKTGSTQIHCLNRLSIQLTLLHHQSQGSNQFNMVAGRGQLHTGCSPIYKHSQLTRPLFSHAAMLLWRCTFTWSCSLCHVQDVISPAGQVWLMCVKPCHAKWGSVYNRF